MNIDATAVDKKHDTKNVKVTFPIAHEGPYTATDAGTTAAAVVLAAAKAHFHVVDDAQHTYVLAFDGQNVEGTATLDEIAGHAHDVKFALVKKITQG